MNDGTETTPATRILSNFATIATPEGELQLVDFEQFDNNEGYPGSLFTSVEPPRTVGIATFNGGQLLNETTKVTVTYTVQDVNGETETTVELDSNVNSGAATVALPGRWNHSGDNHANWRVWELGLPDRQRAVPAVARVDIRPRAE